MVIFRKKRTSKKKEANSGPKEKILHVEVQVERERLFKNFVKYLQNPWSIFWRNFLAGAAHGLGFILGTAILLAILTFILGKLLGFFPFLSDINEALNIWIDKTLEAK